MGASRGLVAGGSERASRRSLPVGADAGVSTGAGAGAGAGVGVGLVGGVSSRLQIAEMQRGRLIAGAVGAVEQYGYAHATVTHITNRARISRRTFYEIFENREDCLAAMFENALQAILTDIGVVISAAGRVGWRERVRMGLWALLSFFDRQPVLARVCVVQALRGDESVLERRAEILSEIAGVIDEGRGAPRARSVPALTAEGLVGAAHAILYARLLKPQGEPLTGLLNDLMGMIVLPYLGADAARREQARAFPPPVTIPAKDASAPVGERNPLEVLPMRVTYRTLRVLECVAGRPGISNRQVADQAGVSDQGQMSKLLSRLERLGLIANTGEGHLKGEPNAWRLTPTGQRVTQSVPTNTNKQAA